MSDFEKFSKLLKTDSDLQAQVKQAQQEFAATLARLSEEAGVPCTAAEFLNASDEIDLTELDKAAGGWSLFPPVDYGPPV